MVRASHWTTPSLSAHTVAGAGRVPSREAADAGSDDLDRDTVVRTGNVSRAHHVQRPRTRLSSARILRARRRIGGWVPSNSAALRGLAVWLVERARRGA